MSTIELQQTEAQFQQAVIDLARACGWLVYHTLISRGSEPGFPDLVLVRGEILIFAELKTEKGRISTAQCDWIEALSRSALAAGDHVTVRLWRPSDWPEIERMLAR